MPNTYYIDYENGNDAYNAAQARDRGATAPNAPKPPTPWKRAPGMQGFAGTYNHQVGDTFVFKGGVAWKQDIFPFVISNSGAADAFDTYTSDMGWYSGGVFSQPVFDGQAKLTAGGMFQADGKSYIKFHNLKWINHGAAGTASEAGGKSPQALNFNNCHHLVFSNLRLQLYCQRSMYIHTDQAGAKDSYVFDGLDVSNCASLLWFTAGESPITTDGWRMSNCYLHDCSSQIGSTTGDNDGVHGDGFVHFFNVNSSWKVTNIEFYGNKVRGNFSRGFGTAGGMTAFFFCEGRDSTFSGNCYNNDFAPDSSDSKLYESFVTLSSAGSLNWYNNTFVNTGGSPRVAGSFFLVTSSGGKYAFKNNILQGLQYAFGITTSTGNVYDIDYNIEDNTSGQNGTTQPPDTDGHMVYFDKWQGVLGYDKHSLLGVSAKFVNAPSDMRLADGSPGIGAATDLSSVFSTDITGDTRLGWDIGAYSKKVSGSVPTPVPTPIPSPIPQPVPEPPPTPQPPVIVPPIVTPSPTPPVLNILNEAVLTGLPKVIQILTPNRSESQNATFVASINCEFSFSGLYPGANGKLRVTQIKTGNRTVTLPPNSRVHLGSSIVKLSADPSTENILSWYSPNGTGIRWENTSF